MASRRMKTRILPAVVLGSGFVALAVVGYVLLSRPSDSLPSRDSSVYEEVTRQFYRGLASLQVGLLDDARAAFTLAAELVPGEPAAWANLGLADLRLGELDAASQALESRSGACADKQQSGLPTGTARNGPRPSP